MHPELISIPFIHLTVTSYGLMLVVGFLVAVALIRRLSRDFTSDPQHITNAALYALIAGVVGARIFFVIHYFGQFRDDLPSVFAIWRGGLELLGGVVLAIAVIIFYIWYHKLPLRHYLDALAIGLVGALIFGRVGCLLNGCCYGKPANLPWAVRFPYGSFAYRSQIRPDEARGREQAYLPLPQDYFGFYDADGRYDPDLKPKKYLTPQQVEKVTKGEYRCLPVHPTQLYASGGAALLCGFLYLLWWRSRKAERLGQYPFLTKPGSIFSVMLMFYGPMRFAFESLRDDNPFEIDHLTIAQLLGVALVIVGSACLTYFTIAKPERLAFASAKPSCRANA
jgi:phosphatidylglycerol:prolipoprotein diacylglycerol transferase